MSSHNHQYLVADGKGGMYWKDPPPNLIPSDEQLEKHPALKQAWDEYMVIRKLLGL